MTTPNSHLVAVHPGSLEILHHLELPEPAVSPHIVTMFEGKIAIYFGKTKSARRYFRDPETKKLSTDETWVVFPMQEGQTAMTAQR